MKFFNENENGEIPVQILLNVLVTPVVDYGGKILKDVMRGLFISVIFFFDQIIDAWNWQKPRQSNQSRYEQANFVFFHLEWRADSVAW